MLTSISDSCEGHRENLFEVVTPNRTFLIQVSMLQYNSTGGARGG